MIHFYFKNIDFMKILFFFYHVIVIFLLLISFYFKPISQWALHGKNLFIKLEKGENENKSKIYKLKKKIDNIIIPKVYFLHFYIIGFVINSILVFQDFYQNYINERRVFDFISYTNIIFEIHLLRRLLEQLLVVRTTSKSFMHIFSYLLGISFYMVTPFSLYNSDKNEYSKLNLISVILFLFGNLIQFDSHVRLAKLRPKDIRKNDVLYKVPYGGFFYYVSCPHYFAEILIYLSFFMLNTNFISLLNFVMVSLILIVNGLKTHNWYIKILKDTYPKQRKAIFPFIL
ncbi:polyprenol reductase, putative [Plasmodium gallinaceum]|uniref:Polyprenol reductase, putative n=1 Tax=Plasmodium gallinaceum TaxID=5849 RepID=A0A1J1GQM1_PLAGA|nr:polyprenol reductase, putative [Plasmodium gallinaceum]CRG94755.1 polyprenol reductase, putative [Plasmodium gallinaceum]